MNDNPAPAPEPADNAAAYRVISIGFGMLLGSTLGAVYGNLVLGMALGIGLGAMFGSALLAAHAEQSDVSATNEAQQP